MKTLQPKLRFPEFSGEWEIKSLGKFADVSKLAGYEFTKHIVYEEEGNLIALRGLNIKKNSLDLTDVKYIDNSELNKLTRSKLYINDIMFTYIGTIGEVAIIQENDKFYLAPNVSRIRIENVNVLPKFILQYFNTREFKENEIAKYVSSSSQPALTMENVRKFELKLPSTQEQTKIANFLSAIDTKINQLTQKKNLLEQYKKGVMQKIFNQEIRFKDDNGNDFEDWEEKYLGEVALKKSSSISANKIEENFGDYIIYGASGVLKKVDFYEEENDYISIVKDGSGVGRVLYCKGKSSVLGTLDIIKPKIEVNTYFLFCLLENIDFTKYITGSTIPHIYFKDYIKENCGVPPLEEQTKIANFLSSIDENINQVAIQLQQTTQYKKGLLQQMFV